MREFGVIISKAGASESSEVMVNISDLQVLLHSRETDSVGRAWNLYF